jgi:hypothetical protein
MLDLGARRGWVVNTMPQPLYPGRDPVPNVQEAGWAPVPVWTCGKNLAPTGIRSLDRPARSQSLYWLSYPAHKMATVADTILHNDKLHNLNSTPILMGYKTKQSCICGAQRALQDMECVRHNLILFIRTQGKSKHCCHSIFCWPCIITYHNNITNLIHFHFHNPFIVSQSSTSPWPQPPVHGVPVTDFDDINHFNETKYLVSYIPPQCMVECKRYRTGSRQVGVNLMTFINTSNGLMMTPW